MAVESAPLAYTTQEEIEEIFSALAVTLRLDDDDDGLFVGTPETESLNQLITEATDIVNQYALHYYDATLLETSRWVRRRASWIAAHLLSRRCGNAAQFSFEYDRAIRDLEMVQTGLTFIPRIKADGNFEPSVSNQVVDFRYARDKLRTDPITSTGGQDASIQPLDYAPYAWPWY